MRVDVLNGVNLDMLGRRDPGIYGDRSLQDLESQIYAWARDLGVHTRCRQTNHEGEYVEYLHAAVDTADAIVLNPGAWTHYSWAIREAAAIFDGPVVEVHLSDVDAREEWRRQSVIEGITTHRITGRGFEGYRDALLHLKETLS
ncbi:MAG: type II 3-dehydroquinate dehydratase [Gaiella sp.]